jgi:hypothetical protein
MPIIAGWLWIMNREECETKRSWSRLWIYECVSKSFRTGRLERELQMVRLSANRCSCIAILWVSLVSFAAITLCVAPQQVFTVVSVHFIMDSVRKLLDTPSYYWISVQRLMKTTKTCQCIPIPGPDTNWFITRLTHHRVTTTTNSLTDSTKVAYGIEFNFQNMLRMITYPHIKPMLAQLDLFDPRINKYRMFTLSMNWVSEISRLWLHGYAECPSAVLWSDF